MNDKYKTERILIATEGPEKWAWQRPAVPDRGEWRTYHQNFSAPSYNAAGRWRLVLRAWAKNPGAGVMFVRVKNTNHWRSVGHEPVWDHDDYDYEFRPHQEPFYTVRAKVPRPLEREPERDAMCFVAAPTHSKNVYTHKWAGTPLGKMWLERGLLYETQKDAIAAADAMLAREFE